MRVEHVLRECSYECNMMSSPFFISLPLAMYAVVRRRGVCSVIVEWEEAARGQTVLCVNLRGTCTSVTE